MSHVTHEKIGEIHVNLQTNNQNGSNLIGVEATSLETKHRIMNIIKIHMKEMGPPL
jgi:hypothetical protein